MSEHVTHKEFLEAIIDFKKEAKDDRHEYSDVIQKGFSSIDNKMDTFNDKLILIPLLNQKVQDHDVDIKELKQDIKSINRRILIATGVVSGVSFAAATFGPYILEKF